MRLASTFALCALAVFAVACDKPSKVVFEPSDDVSITTSEGADLPAVQVKTKSGKSVSKGMTPTITVAPEGIVSLDGGKLTPVKNGKATLTASVPELKPATLEVSVDVVDDVKLSCPNPCTVGVGNRVLINASVHGLGGPVDKPLEWKSAKPDVATVDAATVTGVASGTTTITATAGGKTASLDVTVLPALDELRLYCPNPAYVLVEKKNAPPAANRPPPCQVLQGGNARLLLHGAKGIEVVVPPATWSSSSTGSLLVIDGEISARDLGFASVSAVVGDLKVEMPIQVQSGRVEQCTDPLGYGIETAVTLASGTTAAFMCASPAAGECIKSAAPDVDNAQAPPELMPTVVTHALGEHARRCCCKTK
jgi:hypothetical protein